MADVTSDAFLSSARPDYLELFLGEQSTGRITAEVTAEVIKHGGSSPVSSVTMPCGFLVSAWLWTEFEPPYVFQLGSPGLCAPMLEAEWSVCGQPVGAGAGAASVQLPSPIAVRQLSASPRSITQPGNPAGEPPVRYAVTSTLRVQLEFSDGQLLDFSLDPRTSFSLAQGLDRCSLTAQTGTAPASVSAPRDGPGGAGPCVIQVTFPSFGNESLTAEVLVDVVLLESVDLLLLHYDVASISQFAPGYRLPSRPTELRCTAGLREINVKIFRTRHPASNESIVAP